MFMYATVALVLQLASVCWGSSDEDNSIDLKLVGTWNKSPFKLNLIESFAVNNESTYYPLVNKLFGISSITNEFDEIELIIEGDEEQEEDEDESHSGGSLSDEKFYAFAQSLIEDPTLQALIDIELVNKINTPRIQTHYQSFAKNLDKLVGLSISSTTSKTCNKDTKTWLVDGSESFVYCEPSDVFALKTTKVIAYDKVLSPFDRVIGTDGPLYILYGDYKSQATRNFYRNLYEYASKGKLSFVWRYTELANDTHEDKEVLGGYGVDLTLKRTDYIAIDDRGFSKDQQDKLNFNNEDNEQQVLEKKSDSDEFWSQYHDDIKPLPKSEVELLSYKFTRFIENLSQNSNNSYEMLKKIIFDFPKYAYDIAASVSDDESYDQTDSKTRKLIQAGVPSGLLINGSPNDLTRLDIFTFLNSFKRELGFLKSVKSLGLSSKKALEFILLFGENLVDRLYKSRSSNETFERFDLSDYSDAAVLYINNLAKHGYYQDFVPARQFFEEMPTNKIVDKFPEIRENVNDAIFVFQFSNGADTMTFLKTATAVIQNKIGQQIGVIPLILNELDYALAQQFYLAYKQNGYIGALQYLISVNQEFFPTGYPIIQDQKQLIKEITKFENTGDLDLEEIYFEPIRELMENFGIDSPTIINNGIFVNFDNTWRESMIYQLRVDVGYLKQAFDKGLIPEDTSFREYLMKGGLKQRIPFLIPEVADLDTSYLPKDFNREMALELFQLETDSVFTYSKKSEDEDSPLKTITLIGDSSNQVFIDQVISAFTYLELDEVSKDSIKLRIIDFNSDGELISFLKDVKISDVVQALGGFTMDSGSDKLKSSVTDTLNKLFNIRVISSKDLYILLNGRVIDTVQFSHAFTSDQYSMLVKYEMNLRLNFVHEYINKMSDLKHTEDDGFEDDFDWFEYVSMIITRTSLYHESSIYGSSLLKRVPLLAYEDTVTASSGIDIDDKFMRIDIVGDPMTEQFQRLVGLTSLVEGIAGIDINIHLTPSVNSDESIKIKRFYRYIAGNNLSFDPSSGESIIDGQLECLFDNVPEKTLFTLDIDAPSPWIVNIKEANTDFDNVKLDLIDDGKFAKGIYELKNILVEGHARELERLNRPPVGVSVELIDQITGETYSDTNVMATMGYLQLKANPGVWTFQIKPNTRSKEIYSLVPVDQTLSIVDIKDITEKDKIESKELLILDLRGLTIFPVTIHNKGFESESLLEIDDTGSGSNSNEGETKDNRNILGKAMSFFSSSKDASTTKKKQADINIFSVASGHLYERFLGIMTASVMKHTDHTVKFWLIDNYMSPSFKERLPLLASHFGFEYELITYRWPTWLTRQREKQRTIWGYKILFLDALFPQDLDKVIFVDSDQIVRTDMKELMDLDLQGAPYGYTPMCDSRDEMEGFRFWKTGYWEELLGDDYKYHISALYVIDLKKFRSIAAGDKLRHHYQGLSKDPNSLSNLDQDLPNNLQHTLKIHSLPQEWLWCETWCSDESLKDAKTIDLCNNPLTKEPKLARARRQIPEWTAYDDEITGLFTDSMVVENSTESASSGSHDEL